MCDVEGHVLRDECLQVPRPALPPHCSALCCSTVPWGALRQEKKGWRHRVERSVRRSRTGERKKENETLACLKSTREERKGRS